MRAIGIGETVLYKGERVRVIRRTYDAKNGDKRVVVELVGPPRTGRRFAVKLNNLRKLPRQ